ncbi:hypothetical protein ACKUSY_15925 [Myroides odoratus]
MKKILVLGFAFLLWSCSTEETTSMDSSAEKSERTIDTSIGYKSPYNGTISNHLQNGTINYTFRNETDLDLMISPYFSLGFFDGTTTGPMYQTFLNLASGSWYSPHLYVNGKKYGNYVAANYQQPFFFDTKTFTISSKQVVPIQTSATVVNGFIFDQGNPDGVATTSGEETLLHNFGKLFYAKIEILDYGSIIYDTYAKADFPLVSSSSIYSNTGDWRTLYADSFFNEMMVYNTITDEICIPNTENSIYTSTSYFSYNGKNYQTGISSDEDGVEIYLIEI